MDPLGDEIRRELGRFGPAAGMAELVAAWPAAVGEGIARNAWPARFQRDGVLIVHAVDAVWAFELTQRAGEIAGRLGTLAPRGVKFLPGPLPEPPSDVSQAARTVVREATLSEAQQAAEWAAILEDPELRELVARAARASLARAASDRRF
jgi:Dna[CI] antecedent, DciA